jgi:hypothetical protein
MRSLQRLKNGLTDYRIEKDRRWRRPPAFEVGPATGSPTIYYLAPFDQRPSGGVKMIYTHVDILNNLGIPAAVLHAPDGFRCTWFDNDTRVVSAKSMQFHEDDILVVPECYGPGLHLLEPNVRKVLFNQGPYHTFDRVELEGTDPGAPYSGLQRLEGVMTVSEDGADLLRFVFPGMDVAVARTVIDGRVFRARSVAAPRRIGYVPARLPEEVNQLLHILRIHGIGDGKPGSWEILPVQGLPEHRVAEAMRECSIFLSLSDRDGFGLPPAEAMASGCYVVGYPGGGGNDFFDPAFCRPVTSLRSFVGAVLEATEMEAARREELGSMASAAILGRYNTGGLGKDLEKFYGGML